MTAFREEVLRRRLLLVEEDRHNIDELRDAFAQQGYECEVALDLETARNILQERMMDLAVVNADLAGFDSEAIIEEFKGDRPEMSLVVYNGVRDRTEQRRFRRMGADSYLSEASDLKAVVRSVVNVLQKVE